MFCAYIIVNVFYSLNVTLCLLQFKRNQYSENEQGIARNSETRWKLLESLRLERERSRVDRQNNRIERKRKIVQKNKYFDTSC